MTLRARKLEGDEGFIIGVRNLESGTLVQWNLGGWGNTKHGLQSLLGLQDSLVGSSAGRIETGRWYDIKMVINGPTVKCYLNGILMQQAQVPVPRAGGFFASAARDDRAGEIILKLVNADPQPRDADVRLNGVSHLRLGAREISLVGSKLDEVNSFEEPQKVSPHEQNLTINSGIFRQTVPGNGFVVLRIPAD